MRNCYNCRFFEPDDVVRSGYGVCEPTEELRHVSDGCIMSDSDFNSLVEFIDTENAKETARLKASLGIY